MKLTERKMQKTTEIMKIRSFLMMAVASLFALTACDKENGDKNKPQIKIGVENITENSADVSVDAAEAVDTYYLNVPKSDGIPAAEKIMGDGEKLETSIFTLSGLESSTEYVLAVAAVYSDGEVVVADTGYTTLEDKSVEMADGFMAYDGFDSASGRFRLTVMLSTKSMGDDSAEEYIDIMIPIYLKYELERIDQHTRVVPFGKVMPFYTDGTATADMLYYIGKSFVDQDGGENAQGFSAFVYEGNKVSSTIVADDTDNTEVEIVDNGDGSYTVRGKIVDLRGKEYSFRFTDDKAVFSLDQTEM